MAMDDQRTREYDEALDAIQEAERAKATTLVLRGVVPAQIGKLRLLNRLVVSSEAPVELPAELADLLYLEELGLSDVPVTPSSMAVLRRLIGLRRVDLSYCPTMDWSWLAGARRLEELQLNNCGLTELPGSITELGTLRRLELEDNELADLPLSFAYLSGLESLSLSRNRLTRVPPALRGLHHLRAIGLAGNRIQALPAWLGDLPHLRELVLSGNPLGRAVPGVGHLVQLRELELAGLGLKAVPYGLRHLSSLRRLNLADNKIADLPEWFHELRSLRSLDLPGNTLSELEPLERLPELESLDIGGNPVTSLPVRGDGFAALSRLKITDASQLSVPLEIVTSGDGPAILSFARRLAAEERRSLNEAKLILVGQGGVGKTSVVRMLLGEPFDPDETKTGGIDIRRWQVETSSTTVHLNMWDFGGQEIMHATHQFFLTKRSLYLLVLDSRISEEQNRVDYWIRLIQSFAPDSPIILVGNKSDEHPLDLDGRRLRMKYPNVRAIIETSCVYGTGSAALQRSIADEIEALPHLGDQLLASWFSVKSKLEELDEDYVTYSTYQEMCRDRGITDEQSQTTLIGFLHDLGVVINFRNDPRLQNTNILNPEWVTTGVYGILNSNLLFQRKGILERDDLVEILNPRRFPPSRHMFIVDMMRRFELCFDFEGYADQRFLVPDLLPREEPDTGNWSRALSVEYHYDVLPNSVVSRFIVRMHRHISQQTYWRSGVVLARDDARALIRSDVSAGRVEVLVEGPPSRRRDLLTVVRSEFETIHATIPGLTPTEHVRIPGTHVTVSYDYLRDLERMGESEFVPVGMSERVNVEHLLSGVEPRANRDPSSVSRPAQRPATQLATAVEETRTVPASIAQAASASNRSSPWGSGGFYLVGLVVCVAVGSLLTLLVPWYAVGLCMVFAVLGLALIGILQLRHDDRLDEASFGSAIKQVLKSMTVLSSRVPDVEPESEIDRNA